MQGRIVKGIAGFYYVDTVESGVYECRARGVFRKEGKKPLAGDYVRIGITDEKDREGNILEILPRKNELSRPAAANIDQVLLFFALASPDPNFVVLDRFLLEVRRKNLPAVICFNKTDLVSGGDRERVLQMYSGCGAPVRFVSLKEGTGVSEVRELLKGKVTVLGGPSGAGKSSFANALHPSVRMETGEISKKLSRGKNTTRHTELLPVGPDTYILDTPGFTSLDTALTEAEELADYYPEFQPYKGACRFQPCSHVHEPGCGVREAVQQGEIHPARYESYCRIYGELLESRKRRYR